MTPDHFAVLGEKRRPWVDPDLIKGRFLELSVSTHPDRFHAAPPEEREAAVGRYTRINSAYQILREPKDRLLHLIELETGSRPKDIQRIPPGTMDLFMEIGQSCRDVDALLATRKESTSPLARVRTLQEVQDWVRKLGALQRAVSAKQEEFMERVKLMNVSWESVDGLSADQRRAGLPLEELEQIYRGLSYVHRWTEQIQQRLSDLAC